MRISQAKEPDPDKTLESVKHRRGYSFRYKDRAHVYFVRSVFLCPQPGYFMKQNRTEAETDTQKKEESDARGNPEKDPSL